MNFSGFIVHNFACDFKHFLTTLSSKHQVTYCSFWHYQSYPGGDGDTIIVFLAVTVKEGGVPTCTSVTSLVYLQLYAKQTHTYFVAFLIVYMFR